MLKYKFVTNINCNGCLIKAKRVLDEMDLESWEVDIENPDKILTVCSENNLENEIPEKLKKIGFKANLIDDHLDHA